MSNTSIGQMTWRPDGTVNAEILYLRFCASDPWQPYSDFPEYALPDPPAFSPGYATFLALLKKHWQII